VQVAGYGRLPAMDLPVGRIAMMEAHPSEDWWDQGIGSPG
jgi:hypothetical protein